jgi:hypothetical protein
MVLNELVKQIVAILRYLAAPAVAVVVVWLVDDQHDVVRVAAEAAWPWSKPPSPWPLVSVLGLSGVTVYFAHRTLFHPFVTRILVWVHTRKLAVKPSIDDLAFARWQRRGAADHSGQQSAQSVLDETNAAIHFFYCSGWSSLLIALVFSSAFPSDFQMTGTGPEFGLIVAVFFVTAIVGDYRTARLDLAAYRRYKQGDA